MHLCVKNKTGILTSIARTKEEYRGPGSIVGIATGYGLDGPWIETRCGARFSAPVQTDPGAHQPPVQWVPGLSRG